MMARTQQAHAYIENTDADYVTHCKQMSSNVDSEELKNTMTARTGPQVYKVLIQKKNETRGNRSGCITLTFSSPGWITPCCRMGTRSP